MDIGLVLLVLVCVPGLWLIFVGMPKQYREDRQRYREEDELRRRYGWNDGPHYSLGEWIIGIVGALLCIGLAIVVIVGIACAIAGY